MNRPTYTPPPPPLGAPAPPTPPAPLPVLTAGEKVRHVAAFCGGAAVGGVLVYGTGWAVLNVGLGLLEAGLILLIVGSSVLLVCSLALLPLWREWRTGQLHTQWAQDNLYWYGRHYAALVTAQKAHTAAVYRLPAKEKEPEIHRPGTPTVKEVTTPPPPEPARYSPPPAEPPPTWGERARAMVETVRNQGAQEPPVGEHPTTRLPVLYVAPAPLPRPPRIIYTADMQTIIAVYLATGSAAQRTCEAHGLPRPRWEAAKDGLVAEGVLLPGKNKTVLLAPALWHRDDPAATHAHIARHLAYWP